MKIKAKLNIGVGLLFLMIIVLSVLSGLYINQLKKDTHNILVANYNTLEYSRNMLLALEDIDTDPVAYQTFKQHLVKQQNNVTEIGEKEATENVAKHFELLKKEPQNKTALSSLRKDIAELMRLNMVAIQYKSNLADTTAQKAIVVISVAGTLCFLIAFILMVNLPSNIADPIRQLTASIRQIADQNYKERVHFESHSEFGELARSFNTMAEKLQEYSESKLDKIIKGKKRVETLIDNMHDPVIGIDENNKVLFVNDEALKITNLRKENFVGKLIQDVAVTNDLVREVIRQIIQPEIADSEKKTIKIYADGKESYFEKEIIDINIFPTGEEQSQFIGKVIMLRNITPFKELDLAKTNFLGTVSHEFKTPISSIQMGLQLLENEKIGNLNDEQKNLITGIKEDSDRLLKITGELLNITQLESGSIQLNIQPSYIRNIIEYAVNANKTTLDQKQIQLKVNIEKGLTTVLADSEKTSWVLNNLLSNAIRYSYENSEIEIDVQNENDRVRFSVKDYGCGIDKKYIEKVFDRYFKIPGSKKEGTGLGLSISQQFIKAQGGEILVESELGFGSSFSFILKSE
ncbi:MULTISPECIES: ATP-binding protein [Chryseobacterium]|jgi:PAS domain S-box-containing protein|uniref:histidine kinase n=1 Tax=Chryseobacterium geocarposphaerae TaxID=1416776 RepID=A0ABU1LBD2_9FLAO|nr:MULTISPECIES: ATP-binding protein [Chryseobacterium]MDR6404037.1 PAS domain S-box-containing protein [Chryseobacterium geocarposphaerae]MDR6698444.1 PAS domain S-box-containing protein [Chryseobacterium ginsenosidimutans]